MGTYQELARKEAERLKSAAARRDRILSRSEQEEAKQLRVHSEGVPLNSRCPVDRITEPSQVGFSTRLLTTSQT